MSAARLRVHLAGLPEQIGNSLAKSLIVQLMAISHAMLRNLPTAVRV